MKMIATKKKIVLVSGNFDILHPGHIRLLKFASECGDRLIVAINSDRALVSPAKVDEKHRLEIVRSIEYVDEAFLTDLSAADLVKKLEPWAVVKGKEFENKYNSELEPLSGYGGRLIFGSGEFEISSEQFFRSNNRIGSGFDFTDLAEYAGRRDIKLSNLKQFIDKASQLSVAVIGEIIVDEYVQGNAIGLSQEDPTIVMTPSQKETFLGGAAITSGHLRAIGADSVVLFSVLGSDEPASYAISKIQDYDVEPCFFVDESRPTPLKTRYRVDKKTLLRVNEVRQHKISNDLQDSIYEAVSKRIDSLDLLVFSDFNYGMLPQRLVDKLCELCRQHDVRIIADSQTSSQVGDISRYRNVLLMTPTEKEVRVALNNPDDGLVILANKLCERSTPDYLVITLGSEGSFIHKPDPIGEVWENDRLPAVNKNAIDPAGAGDCYLASCGLMLAAGADIWQACYVASIASACQVDRLGNTPLSAKILTTALEESFNLS